jgi:glycosyltransferase involved in cell wall biosynthesis
MAEQGGHDRFWATVLRARTVARWVLRLFPERMQKRLRTLAQRVRLDPMSRQPVNQSAVRMIPEVPERRRRTWRRPLLPGFNIVGYVRSEHGVGESARLCARAAEAAGLPFCLVDFNVDNHSRTGVRDWEHKIRDRNDHQVNLLHINADQMPLAYQHLGSDFFQHRYNIGYWAWELPEFPDGWTPSFELVDEVWSPSSFVVETVSRKSTVPVLRMPHAIRIALPPDLQRADLGLSLPDDRFLFLAMYDTLSVQARKNPQAAIEAFRRAFPDPRDVGLVVKINNPARCADEVSALKASLQSTAGIWVVDQILTRQEVYNLEMVCDAFVSLHRSEGFGLALAESMYLGKPVIATAWSGNMDFMNADNACPVRHRLVHLEQDYGPYAKGQCWAEPDVEQASWYMRRLVAEGGWRRQIGLRGQQTIETEFSPEAVGRLYRQRLAVIQRRLGFDSLWTRRAS